MCIRLLLLHTEPNGLREQLVIIPLDSLGWLSGRSGLGCSAVAGRPRMVSLCV